MQLRICESCGSEFEIDRPSSPKKFCNQECYHGFRGSKGEATCLQCGTTFNRKTHQAAKYCGQRCRNLAARGKPHSDRSHDVVCAQCGDTFNKGKSGMTFCSRECYLQNCSENRTKVTYKTKLPYVPGWTKIQKQVKERDNYTCQSCGREVCKSNNDWAVHHTIDRSNNELENLVLLCRKCHTYVTDLETVMRAENAEFGAGHFAGFLQGAYEWLKRMLQKT